MVVLLIILMLASHFLALSLVRPVLYICFAAIAMSLFSLMFCRAAQEKAAGSQAGPVLGRVLVALALVLILLFALGLVAIAADGTQSLSQALFGLLRWCGTTLKNLGAAFMELLERFLTWLISFLPEEKFDTLEGSLESSAIEGNFKSSGIPIPKWVWFLLGTLAAVLLIRFFLSMLHERTGQDPQQQKTVTSSTRSGTLLSGLRELWSLLRAKIAFRIARIRGRKTAPGLLLWCEGHAPRESRRKVGESGPAFLLRLSHMELPQAQKDALLELSRAVEISFYSPAAAEISPELYKTIHGCKF